MSSYPIHMQVRDQSGAVVIDLEFPEDVGVYSGVAQAIQLIKEKIGSGPKNGALVGIVNGRAVKVQSAPHILESPWTNNDSMAYAISMAQHSFDDRNKPEYALVPPVYTFQQLYFCADSDAANLCAAAMIDRISYELARDADLADKVLDDDGEAEMYFLDKHLYELEKFHPEFGDTNIRDMAWDEYQEVLRSQRHHRDYKRKYAKPGGDVK